MVNRNDTPWSQLLKFTNINISQLPSPAQTLANKDNNSDKDNNNTVDEEFRSLLSNRFVQLQRPVEFSLWWNFLRKQLQQYNNNNNNQPHTHNDNTRHRVLSGLLLFADGLPTDESRFSTTNVQVYLPLKSNGQRDTSWDCPFVGESLDVLFDWLIGHTDLITTQTLEEEKKKE